MSFSKTSIPFNDTGFFSQTINDYLNNDEKLKPFFSFNADIDSYAKKIEERKSTVVNRNILVDVLKSQYKNINDFKAASIELLHNENTFTVTTGHQLNLFTGPLYFVYKIVSAIKLSQLLKEKYSHYNFIPVYWMASEDHDFAEINHIHVFDKTIEWNTDAKGACGRLNPNGLTTQIEELKNLLGESENNNQLISIFNDAYTNHATLAEAMRYIVNKLFGKYGLLVIDADNALLKKHFAGIIKDELLNESSQKCVGATTQLLEANYKPQIKPRAINLFYLKDNLRERIEKNENGFTVLNTDITFSEKEILEEVDAHPERFSPNVVLRPLYQELLLPNLAYIGGGAEVAYWFQLKGLFEHYAISFPVLMLRDSVMIIEKKLIEKLNALNINPKTIFKSYDETVRQYLIENTGDINLQTELKAIETSFENISKKIAEIDSTLVQTTAGEKQKVLNSIKMLEEKAFKAMRRKNETALNQIKTVRSKLFPNDELQERFFNLSMFYSRFGLNIIDTLLQHQNPFEKEFKILIEE